MYSTNCINLNILFSIIINKYVPTEVMIIIRAEVYTMDDVFMYIIIYYVYYNIILNIYLYRSSIV